jgi:hypothetical protein
MAANDYYNTSYPPTGQQHGTTPGRTGTGTDSALPPPPLPGAQSQNSLSPFDDHHNDYYQTPNSSGALGGYPSHNTSYSGQQDPFTDHNAIPLHSQPTSHTHKLDDSPTRYNADPEAFPRPSRKRSKKKKGWFSGRVTWVVYILTTVQIGVFVGELIKNGTAQRTPQPHPQPS